MSGDRKRSGNRIQSTSARRQQGGRTQSVRVTATVSILAIILGIMITAHDYLERHTKASIEAQAAVTESLADTASAVPDYVKAVLSEDASQISETEKLTGAAKTLSAENIPEQSKAYMTISSTFDKLTESGISASSNEAKKLSEALAAAEEAAVAYNKEAAALNEKVGKFPYNIIARIAGYTEYPIFDL